MYLCGFTVEKLWTVTSLFSVISKLLDISTMQTMYWLFHFVLCVPILGYSILVQDCILPPTLCTPFFHISHTCPISLHIKAVCLSHHLANNIHKIPLQMALLSTTTSAHFWSCCTMPKHDSFKTKILFLSKSTGLNSWLQTPLSKCQWLWGQLIHYLCAQLGMQENIALLHWLIMNNVFEALYLTLLSHFCPISSLTNWCADPSVHWTTIVMSLLTLLS